MVAPSEPKDQQNEPLRATLTDRALDALKPSPSGKRRIVWDLLLPGLGVRVTDRGTRTFVIVKRRPGAAHPETVVLGKYPAMALKAARKNGRTVLETISEGKVPSEAAAEARRAEVRRRKDTFGAAVASFLADGVLAGLRSGPETEAILRRAFLGQTWQRVKQHTDGKMVRVKRWGEGPDHVWSNRPIAQITRREVIERLDEIKARGGKHAARHALGAVRRFFSWCAEGERFGVEASPCASIRDKTFGITGRDLRRTRVLGDAELRDIWAAAERLTAMQRKKALATNAETDVSRVFDPAEPLVKMLLLTGQRLSDIAKASWCEIDLEKAMLLVPPFRFKTGVAQEVPLSGVALDVLKALPGFGNGYVLTTTVGERPFSGILKMKERLDKAIAEKRAKDHAEPMPPWVFHDMRRSVRTRLTSDLGVDAYIAERCIGHALVGLHSVYDRGSHRVQKRDALERWAAALAVIVGLQPTPEGGAVVPVEEVQRRRKARRA